MNLYILRHASAGTRRANPAVDVKRPLDKEGKQQCMLVGGYLNTLKTQFDHIYSSPLKRSQQTACFVGTEVGYESKIAVTEALAPSATLRQFLDMIDSLHDGENILLVGHNPNLSTFLGSLISTGKTSIRLRKGAIARVDYTRRPGTLLWLVEPRILRNIYGKVTSKSRRKTSRK